MTVKTGAEILDRATVVMLIRAMALTTSQLAGRRNLAY
jgi:hypothetical protein